MESDPKDRVGVEAALAACVALVFVIIESRIANVLLCVFFGIFSVAASIGYFIHNDQYALKALGICGFLFLCSIFMVVDSFRSHTRWRRLEAGCCESCGHFMDGIFEGNCPECGELYLALEFEDEF